MRGTRITLAVLIVIIGSIILQQSETMPTSGGMPAVIIDAGHGLPDGGASGKSGVSESEINLKIAKIVEKELKKAGISTLMTREGEEGLYKSEGASTRSKKREDLKERVKIFNGSGAKFVISIHMNYFGVEKYSGPQLFCPSGDEQAKRAAENIKNSMLENVGKHCTRAIKEVESGIYIIDNCSIPIVLAECGFLSNRVEEKLLLTEKYQEKMGKAIAEGIITYLNDYS